MILTCDKCTTKYFVDQGALLPAGKNVKCVKCGYIWYQDASSDQAPPKNIKLDPIPHGSSLPVIVEMRNSIWLKLLPAFFACMILVTSVCIFRDEIINRMPITSRLYDLIGISTIDNVKLENISLIKNKDFLNVSGLIVNHAPTKRKVPDILISISDLDGKKLTSGRIDSSELYLNPEEKYPLHKRIFNLPDNAHYVTIDIADLLR